MTKIWGKHFWIFMHSLAECVSEKCYSANKQEICSIYNSICSNLPCPDCTKHATRYIKGKLNANVLNTKDKLKSFLFTFHNDVNRRLRKPKFTDFHMYEKAKLTIIYKNFEYYFSKNYTPNAGFHNNFHKRLAMEKIREFIKKNKNEIKWN